VKYTGYLIVATTILIIASALILLSSTKPPLTVKDSKLETATATENVSAMKTITIEELASAPDNYPGQVGVVGTVLTVNKSEKIFTLGCSDACIKVPVEYDGSMPVVNKEVVVIGELKKGADNRYVFQAKEVKVK